MFSGFSISYENVTMKTFSLNLLTPFASLGGKWIEKDPVPIVPGLTHAASAIVNNSNTNQIVYLCGGYVGGHPGPATDKCFSYTHNAPPGYQWNNMTSLPEPRSGGAMWYDSRRQSLIYATGASRPDPTDPIFTIDHNDVWELRLRNMRAGWIVRPSVPYVANHVGKVTVNYLGLRERHFIVGGQIGENETYGNLDDVYEYRAYSQQWIARRKMPFRRGHFSESTIVYKDCGFFIVAGAINTKNGNFARTQEITYYDICTDTWTAIGNFTQKLATPVCAFHNDYLYCQSGPISGYSSVRRKLL